MSKPGPPAMLSASPPLIAWRTARVAAGRSHEGSCSCSTSESLATRGAKCASV